VGWAQKQQQWAGDSSTYSTQMKPLRRGAARPADCSEMTPQRTTTVMWLAGHSTRRRGPGAPFLCKTEPRRKAKEGSHRRGGNGSVVARNGFSKTMAPVLLLLRQRDKWRVRVQPVCRLKGNRWTKGISLVRRRRSAPDKESRQATSAQGAKQEGKEEASCGGP
jgi:hypothetical protein